MVVKSWGFILGFVDGAGGDFVLLGLRKWQFFFEGWRLFTNLVSLTGACLVFWGKDLGNFDREEEVFLGKS